MTTLAEHSKRWIDMFESTLKTWMNHKQDHHENSDHYTAFFSNDTKLLTVVTSKLQTFWAPNRHLTTNKTIGFTNSSTLIFMFKNLHKNILFFVKTCMFSKTKRLFTIQHLTVLRNKQTLAKSFRFWLFRKRKITKLLWNLILRLVQNCTKNQTSYRLWPLSGILCFFRLFRFRPIAAVSTIIITVPCLFRPVIICLIRNLFNTRVIPPPTIVISPTLFRVPSLVTT